MKLAELDPAAREKAIAWYAKGQGEDFEWDYDDFVVCLGFMGIQVSTRAVETRSGVRQEPDFEWSGFYSQGDGFAFGGVWRATGVNWLALEEHAPSDEELDRLGKEFTLMALRYPHGTADIGHKRNCVSIDETSTNTETDSMEWENMTVEHEFLLLDHVRDVADWCYRRLRDEYEYQTSEEACVEGIECNEYSFAEDGTLA